ncbi:class I SAM-dependent methyltransferase [Dysgonomonas sp. 216]|uniref:class I SAM-dependent methyltransferase n=1 Tax=Dysgonomonas sp. 216 TaxID=2302934 RepID=UPI0013D204E1|nr:class I SAM-dependent methyltransferase [Dysgonomonas sp. 216]NDW18323.1 class I SAM-dependent methyltransferase [Dysgonomonas sp. 216]NDW18691.1 class I SAM-dependent methyltransferase [Dysgonomonas sp. 216]
MQERHLNGKLYFDELTYSTKKYIIPYINKYYPIASNMRILEIGCGAGGNLLPFLEMGCEITGFDLNKPRIEEARKILDADNNPKVNLFCEDVFKVNGLGKFDIILVRDVIEHIPDKENFFRHMKGFLKENGVAYFGFPAWYMPFGGHQQLCRNKFLSHLPFFHILPTSLYKGILSAFKENKGTIDELISIKECGITIEQFRKYSKTNGYDIVNERLYFINPHYEIKFKLKPRKLSLVIGKIPFIRNFFTTGCFFLIKQDK